MQKIENSDYNYNINIVSHITLWLPIWHLKYYKKF